MAANGPETEDSGARAASAPRPAKKRLCYKMVPEEANNERRTRRRLRGTNSMAEHVRAHEKKRSSEEGRQQQPTLRRGDGSNSDSLIDGSSCPHLLLHYG